MKKFLALLVSVVSITSLIQAKPAPHRSLAPVSALIRTAPYGEPASLALIRAINAGNVAEVERLLAERQSRANPNAFNRSGISCLALAAQMGNEPIVRMLLQAGANPIQPTRISGLTPLMFACQAGHLACVQTLLGRSGHGQINARSANESTPLFFAAQAGDTDTVAFLLAQRASVDTPNVRGISPLMIAARNARAQAVTLLLDARAHPNRVAFDGRTALLEAAQNLSATDMQEYFDEQHTSLRVDVPAWDAARLPGDTPEAYGACVRVLLAAGAQLNPTDAGTSALERADAAQNHRAASLIRAASRA